MYNVKIKQIVENTQWNIMRSLEVATELVCKNVSRQEKIFETYLQRRYSEIFMKDK